MTRTELDLDIIPLESFRLHLQKKELHKNPQKTILRCSLTKSMACLAGAWPVQIP